MNAHERERLGSASGRRLNRESTLGRSEQSITIGAKVVIQSGYAIFHKGRRGGLAAVDAPSLTGRPNDAWRFAGIQTDASLKSLAGRRCGSVSSKTSALKRKDRRGFMRISALLPNSEYSDLPI